MQEYEKEHRALVLRNSAECVVLLKTDGKFPIDEPGRIAAYGSGMRYTVMGGTGSGEVNTRFAYTLEQGLEKAGFTCEGTLKSNAFKNGKIMDMKMYARLKG